MRKCGSLVVAWTAEEARKLPDILNEQREAGIKTHPLYMTWTSFAYIAAYFLGGVVSFDPDIGHSRDSHCDLIAYPLHPHYLFDLYDSDVYDIR